MRKTLSDINVNFSILHCSTYTHIVGDQWFYFPVLFFRTSCVKNQWIARNFFYTLLIFNAVVNHKPTHFLIIFVILLNCFYLLVCTSDFKSSRSSQRKFKMQNYWQRPWELNFHKLKMSYHNQLQLITSECFQVKLIFCLKCLLN